MQVVVKFLRKSSVLKDCWVNDKEMGRVPREIQLLAHLSHPNIVQVDQFDVVNAKISFCLPNQGEKGVGRKQRAA